ncbi:hypothetical protein [Pseudomonas fulva]|uniref:hypothetical protein n=1 Tax=Pseudomonas fulva TaxID=47880 RepID=UPI0034CEEF0F
MLRLGKVVEALGGFKVHAVEELQADGSYKVLGYMAQGPGIDQKPFSTAQFALTDLAFQLIDKYGHLMKAKEEGKL